MNFDASKQGSQRGAPITGHSMHANTGHAHHGHLAPHESANVARKADMYFVGKQRAQRVQHQRQGEAVPSAMMDESDGLPAKEALQAMYRITRDKTIKDVLIFMAYTAVLIVASLGIFDVHMAFTANETARQWFSARATPGVFWKKTFFDIQQYDEIISWLNIAHDGFVQDVYYGPLLSSEFGHSRYW